MAEWIISGNPKKFDVLNAFRDLQCVDWTQSANFHEGDIVYIYVSGDIRELKFKCRANKVDIVNPTIYDQKYNLSGEYDGRPGRYMELEMLEEFSGPEYSYAELIKHGFSSPQSPVHLNAEVKAYLESIRTAPSADYWPTPEEYDPGITKEKWVELLNDSSVTYNDNLKIFKMMLELGGESTCANLAEKYGGVHSWYNSLGWQFGERVSKKVHCSILEKDQRNYYFVIPYLGRYVTENEKKRYSWKLRDELRAALEEMDLSGIDISIKERSNSAEYSKNMILCGPPGTGKTYNSAVYAVAICDDRPLEDVQAQDYSETFQRYNELKEEGRIAFTTFHQSYGYEEFIEGIKPVVDENTSGIGYTIASGVFKRFCESAVMPQDIQIDHKAKVWFVRLNGAKENDLKSKCFRDGVIRFNWSVDAQDDYIRWLRQMCPGDFVVSYYGSSSVIDAVGIVQDEEPRFDESKPSFCWMRDVKWLVSGIQADIKAQNGNTYLPNFEVAKLGRMKISDLLTIVDENGGQAGEKNDKPYVFIIDEINRGNISKIFGELITLIEDTKRKGMEEEASAILPYSGEVFSVPANVYLLGTMNTADRSIAIMDTALRRRFQFIEMMPDADVLREIGADKVEDLDVAAMLETINERISVLYDREHTIGHAFFTRLAESPTLETLKDIFEKSVIPLLQEYFYEDYQKIQLVLGDNGKDDSLKFILSRDIKAKDVFKGSADEMPDLPGKKYTINKEAFSNIESYKQIL